MNRPVTSASNLRRRLLCPGSANLEAGLPDEDSEQSREGVLMHDYKAHPEYDRSVLKPNQRDLLERDDSLEKVIGERLEKELNGPPVIEAERERTFDNGMISGTADLVTHFPTEDSAAWINDTKFGYKIVERAELNLQLRAYAVLVYDAEEKRPKRIFVSITQPRLSYEERITLAQYVEDQIEESRLQIAGILEASSKKDAKLVAGDEQCRYCKAKLICPAFQKTLAVPVTSLKVNQELSKTAREAYLAQRLTEVSDNDLEKLMTAVSLAGMVKPFAWDEARKRIENGTLTNFKLSKPSEKRDIVDPQRAIALLEMAGVATREAILSFCSVPLGKLEEAYRTAHPGLTWQECKDKINKVLQSVIEKQEIAPKIIRK